MVEPMAEISVRPRAGAAPEIGFCLLPKYEEITVAKNKNNSAKFLANFFSRSFVLSPDSYVGWFHIDFALNYWTKRKAFLLSDLNFNAE